MNISPFTLKQATFFDSSEALDHFPCVGIEERGAIFTKHEVVEFILDLVGYTSNKPLHELRILEPSSGEGDFLIPIVERLLEAYKLYVVNHSNIVEDLKNSICSFEVHHGSINITRSKILNLLYKYGVSEQDVCSLLSSWIIERDFLLSNLHQTFTHIVGNPPYVRQELIPDKLLNEYRKRYSTIYDRADLYVPFIEHSLLNLEPSGTLGFICSDRWMKNKYGGPLRALIAKHYHLMHYIDMVDTPAFHSDVIAYPAITIIRREKPGSTRIAHRPLIDNVILSKLSQTMLSEELPEDSGINEIMNVVVKQEPWILHSFDQLAVVRRLESDFVTLEEAGCKVGIGVATGADKVFIDSYDNLDVEPSRKLPLVGTKDIEKGIVKWRGFGVINPFNNNGTLVDLNKFPKLSNYFEINATKLRKRHCSENNPKAWYRTIDRIYPEFTYRPKLLIPDIKGKANIVYEDGHFYPHHNLYYITSEKWDLKALQVVLKSGIAKLFISTYSTQMRGGYLRFQAQYLRRIRIPQWEDIPPQIKTTLISLSDQGNENKFDDVIKELYRLSRKECEAIGVGNNGN
jgi:hypothetical protein